MPKGSSVVASKESHSTQRIEKEFGRTNPDGACDTLPIRCLDRQLVVPSRVTSANRDWQMFRATWVSRYILDGYAIRDEHRMTGSLENCWYRA